ncbi:MAG: serine/threonine protein kinase [Micrococcales bacterium]|nr:MAG: serine/threonine protein kinase [Micrococcales bacterium]PIE26636.1 MAG: serine/threonine protein kinase [Micrococcales bacterium]
MTTSTDPLLGNLLDHRYEVNTRIARGGMATVYRATDLRLDREVAVKVMHPHRAEDEQFVSRFIREARSAARISHPNVVAVYDQGADGETVYLVMEYVHGQTLRDALTDRHAFTPREALDVLGPMLSALSAAHRAGLVHRDMKPENVLLANDENSGTRTIKVADFGLARAASTSASSDALIGTAAYLSPELVSRGIADARTDVYACGIMLFEMLTGQIPYSGEAPAHIAYQHVSSRVPAPSTIEDGLPEQLDRLVSAATQPDPDERPRDAADFAQHVQAARAELSAEQLDRRPQAAAASGTVQHTRVVSTSTEIPLGAGFGPTGNRTAEHAVRAAATFPAARRDASGTRVPRKRRLSSILLAVLLVALAAAGGSGWYFTAGPGAYTVAPKVNGTEAQVLADLDALGFSADVSEQYDESAPAGTVIGTDPAEGERLRKHGTIGVVVSKGSAFLAMPDVAGRSMDEATGILQREEIGVRQRSKEYSQDVAKGSVIRTEPAAGERIKRGTDVAVVLSRGREPLSVPDQVGQPVQQAQATLSETGFQVSVTEEFSEEVPQGSVISQEPRSGQAFRGDTVTLVVSKGPPLVDVPSVIGKPLEQARQELEDAGFTVEIDEVMGGYFGTVRNQNPADGQAPNGSTVTLTVV